MDLTKKIVEMSMETNSPNPSVKAIISSASNASSQAPSTASATPITTFSSILAPNDRLATSKNGAAPEHQRDSLIAAPAKNNSYSPAIRMTNLLDAVRSPDTLDTQKQKLKNLVEQISNQEAQLCRLKSLLKMAKEQTAVNTELNNELKTVNRSIDERDGELREALNRIDNLNRQLVTSRRNRAYRCGKNSRPGSENKTNLSNGRRVSFDPLALLLDAAFEGELDLVIQTSKQVPDLSASHDECVTALHNATVVGHYEVAKYLIEAGCDVNVQDSDGWTPLHCAASCNNLPLVKLLIENGALIYATTYGECLTPAMKCEKSEEGFDDCYNYLIHVQNNLGVINNGIVYALYDYEAQQGDELSFQVNDELIVLRRDDSEEQEWWWAQKRAKQSSDKVLEIKEGYIPRNLVGLYPRAAAYDKTKRFNYNNSKRNSNCNSNSA